MSSCFSLQILRHFPETSVCVCMYKMGGKRRKPQQSFHRPVFLYFYALLIISFSHTITEIYIHIWTYETHKLAFVECIYTRLASYAANSPVQRWAPQCIRVCRAFAAVRYGWFYSFFFASDICRFFLIFIFIIFLIFILLCLFALPLLAASTWNSPRLKLAACLQWMCMHVCVPTYIFEILQIITK